MKDTPISLDDMSIVTMGVGDGSGNMYITGSYDTITSVRDRLNRLAKLEAYVEKMTAEMTNAIGGGSELFMRIDDDTFVLDYNRASTYIRTQREDKIRVFKKLKEIQNEG